MYKWLETNSSRLKAISLSGDLTYDMLLDMLLDMLEELEEIEMQNPAGSVTGRALPPGSASENRRAKNGTDMSRGEADQLAARAQGLFDKPVMYYVKQVDQFMQTYPVCKRMQLTRLLDQLVSVWAAAPLNKRMGYGFIPKATYKDIEGECLSLYR